MPFNPDKLKELRTKLESATITPSTQVEVTIYIDDGIASYEQKIGILPPLVLNDPRLSWAAPADYVMGRIDEHVRHLLGCNLRVLDVTVDIQ